MEQLEKYCLTSRKKFYVISVILLIIGEVAGTAVMMAGDIDSDGIENPVLAAILTGIILIIFWIGFHHVMITLPRKAFKLRIAYFQQQGLLEYAISDVQRGVKKFDGRVLLGQYCLMGRGTGLIVFYNEISSLYVKIDRSRDDDGSTVETWELKLDAGGKTYEICTVPKTEQSVREWSEICTFIGLKAPNIQIR